MEEESIRWIDEAIKKVKEFIRTIETSESVKGVVKIEELREAVVVDKATKIRGTIISRLKKTDPIVASQEALVDYISEINKIFSPDIDSISSGIRDLVWVATGSREIIDMLELHNSKRLEEMRKSLERPLSAQAKELKRRAEFAYLNGWIDEAESDLLKVTEENYEDFTVHQMLGNIYRYHRNDYYRAIEFYRKVVKYAAPRSKEYATDVLIRIAECYHQLSQMSDAYKSMNIALEILPEDLHVLYHCARYAVREGHEFMNFLEKCIHEDPVYLIAADIDEMFFSVREEVRKLAKNLRDKRKADIDNMLQEIELAKQEAKVAGITNFSFLEEQLTGVNELYSRGSYFDLLKLERILPEIYNGSIAMWAEEKKAHIAILCSELNRLELDTSKYEDQMEKLIVVKSIPDAIFLCIGSWIFFGIIFGIINLIVHAVGADWLLTILGPTSTLLVIGSPIIFIVNDIRTKKKLYSKLKSVKSMIEKTKTEIKEEEARLKRINEMRYSIGRRIPSPVGQQKG
jgi:tetratricopeptide (TPR) repeat protein